MLEREEKVVRLMIKRSFKFTCSFNKAWERMTEKEKDGFTYNYILLDYMANT